ncbi:MAG: hypothetical protein Ct9H300mP25_07640 [Acidobacteriota bacterium]|nr:MAG: hypothetical protein Ct9H300mP25_07640 [Acidobacteriota bacterium]
MFLSRQSSISGRLLLTETMAVQSQEALCSDVHPLTTSILNQSTLEEPQDPLKEISLDQFPGSLRAAVGHPGWSELMPVQARAIPYLLAGRTW